MPSVELVSRTDTSITVRLGGLQNPATSTYYDYIALSKTNTPSETVPRWGSVSNISGGYYYTGDVTFSGLTPGTSYNFRGDVTPKGSTMQSFYDSFSTTGIAPDTTPPTVNVTSYSGLNNLTLYWSASDNVALRSTDTFSLWISGPGDSTLSFVTYLGNSAREYTFTTDRFGNPLQPNTVYLARVTAVDSSNNTASSERYVTVTRQRPSDFNWTYAKTSESNNLYASEWNALIDKMNEFRVYKGFTAFTHLTNAYSGGDFYAYMFNEMRNAIASMSPPTAAPASVGSETYVYASQLNALRNSLNSIT